MKLKVALLALLLISLGCGLELEEGGTEAQEIIQTKSLLVEYSSITGTYEGLVLNQQRNKEYKIIIKLFIIAEQSGVDVYGKPKLFPALKAHYQIELPNAVDPRIGSLTMNAKYVEENSTITLGNPVATPNSQYGNSQPMFSLTGTIKSGVLEGHIYNHFGYFGYFDGQMTIKDKSYDGLIEHFGELKE